MEIMILLYHRWCTSVNRGRNILKISQSAKWQTREADLKAESRWRTEVTDEMLSLADVLVDGPFLESKKDISLQFRGSSNQRILNLREMLPVR